MRPVSPVSKWWVTKSEVMEALANEALPGISKSAAVAALRRVVAAPTAAASVLIPQWQILPFHKILRHFKDNSNNKMRKIIASRLTESKRDVPHY
jgi:pyruvate/2-oxoglutarate dehydrogenase complex dihydrolipoamide acyltransferase (E2) component